MAASIELDEQNTAAATLRHAILNSNFGSIDAFELDDVANRLQLNSNSFEKWQRLHVPDLGGSSAVRDLRISSGTPRPTGTVLVFNGHTVQATYDGSKKTSFSTPGTGTANTPYHVPTSKPSSSNLGFGGQLAGTLVAPGTSDYLVIQVRLDGTVTVSAKPVIVWDLFETA